MKWNLFTPVLSLLGVELDSFLLTYKHESIQIAVMISLTRSMDENIICNTFYIRDTL